MRWILRGRIAGLVTTILLSAGAFPSTGTVLCIGPGHHCHFENPMGDSCATRASALDHSAAPKAPDGCPKGSRDVTLSIPVRPSEKGIAALAFNPPLAVLAGNVRNLMLFPIRTPFAGDALAKTPQRSSSTILRC